MSRSAHPAGPRHGDVLPEGHYLAPPADLNRLDPKVWSRTVGRDEDGVATVGGVAVTELAAEFGTPAYLLDEDDFRARARAWRDAFGEGADVYYAGKAFLSKAVARWVHEEGLSLDVCSGGRAGRRAARRDARGADRPARQQQVASRELAPAVEAGVGRIVVD